MRLEVVRLYGRLLRFLRPHLGPLIGSILFMAAFAAFSGFSLAMIVPFTEIILSGKNPVDAVEVVGHGQPVGKAAPDSAEADAGPDSSAAGAMAEPTAGPDLVPSVERGIAAAQRVAPAAEPEAKGTIAALRARAESRFYEAIRGRDRQETMTRFCLILLLVFLLKNLFWYAQSFLIVRVEQDVIRDIRNRVFAHYQTLSQDYFSASHSGVLISRVTNDVDLVRGAIANGIADLLRQSLLLTVYLLTVLLASWKLFLFAVLVLPPNLWLIDRIGHTLRRSSRVSQAKMARLTSVLSESLTGMRVVRAFGLEAERVARFSEETHSYARTMIRMTRVGSLASPLTEMLGVVVACAILWYAGSRLTGEGASGRFLLFLVGMLSMMQPIKVLSQVNIKIQQGLAAARRIFEVLDTAPTVAERPGSVPVSGFHDAIRYEQVSFAYRPGVPVLKSVDLEISRGRVVALVGPSGGGKSTLIDLLPRFYDPAPGRITLDGVDLRDLSLSGLRALLGLVTQETILFEGSVRQNIRLGRLDASDVEIEEAARVANAHEFIEQLPEGYDTQIGERGQRLSGGQRQRLSIARAVLKNPAILIFDEATSALDSESERLVQEAIDRLLAGRTAVVVAHRLSTIRRADLIVVLDGGQVLQSGRHEDLLASGGLYRRLYEMQFQDPGERAPAESL